MNEPIEYQLTNQAKQVYRKDTKDATRGSPNCIRKTMFCGTQVSVPLPKNCLPTQNFTEIGQSAAGLWPQTIFNMAAVRHLELDKFSYSVA